MDDIRQRPMADGFSVCVAGLVVLVSLVIIGIAVLTAAGVAR
jgi:Tfp pilus assembly protein PilV